MKSLLCIAFGCLLLVGCSDRDSASSLQGDDTTQTSFNLAGAPTVEFDVPDMMCPEGCGVKTKEILSEQPGVKEVVIKFDEKTAVVAVDNATFDADAAVAALVDHGFEHSSLKATHAP